MSHCSILETKVGNDKFMEPRIYGIKTKVKFVIQIGYRN